MNTTQKIATVLALVALGITIIWAPWLSSFNTDATNPIWSPPYNNSRLRFEILVAEWCAIGILYAGIYWLLRKPTAK